MSELLPCPFCGGTNIYVDGYDHAAGKRWRVMCLDCMATVDPGTIQQKYRAIEAWNRRAQPENARQRAIETDTCPMCEDCPDGCPVETPTDSRNKQENEPLTCEGCVDYDVYDDDVRCYGCKRLVRITDHYRRKPERSEG